MCRVWEHQHQLAHCKVFSTHKTVKLNSGIWDWGIHGLNGWCIYGFIGGAFKWVWQWWQSGLMFSGGMLEKHQFSGEYWYLFQSSHDHRFWTPNLWPTNSPPKTCITSYLVDVCILLFIDNCIPGRQLDGCSVTRPFLSGKAVACKTRSREQSYQFICNKTMKHDWSHGLAVPIYCGCHN